MLVSGANDWLTVIRLFEIDGARHGLCLTGKDLWLLDTGC